MKTNKWKLALLVWSAMFPFSTAMNYGLTWLSFTAHWPLVVRTFCLTCLLVPFMVFGALPFLNRHFRTWLQITSPIADDRSGVSVETVGTPSANSQAENGSRIEPYDAYPRLTTNGVRA